MALRLCRWSDLPDPGSLGFEAGEPGQSRSCVLIRRGEQVWAYENRCPHTGSPLDWRPGEVLDPEGAYIQCALHLARFRMENGLCIHGPCLGQSLRALAVERRGEWVVLLDEGSGGSRMSGADE